MEVEELQLINLDNEQLLEIFKMNRVHINNFDELYRQARFGIHLMFDMLFYAKELFYIYKKRETVKIHDKEYNLSLFLTEIEDRRVLMLGILQELNKTGQLVTPFTEDETQE